LGLGPRSGVAVAAGVRVTQAEQIDAVVAKMAQGMSERAACRDVGIDRSTFRMQSIKHLSASQYAEALRGLAMDQVDKLENTIDDMRLGVLNEDGTRGEKLDPAIGRIEIDARKWFASKFLPKQFGDKLAVGGADDLPALKQEVSVAGLSPATLRELAGVRLPDEV